MCVWSCEMARSNREAIETLMSITGVSELVAVEKFEEHDGDLIEAVNAHFSEADRNIIPETSTAAPQNNTMDIHEPIQVGSRGPPFSLLSSTRNLIPLSLLDPNFSRSLFDSGPDFTNRAPFVSHPREVREIPIEVKDGGEQSGHSVPSPSIEDVTRTARAQGPETRGKVIIDDGDDEDIPAAPSGHTSGQNEQKDYLLGSNDNYPRPSVTGIDDFPYYSNDVEEEMIRAAIEASKREVGKGFLVQQFGADDDLSNPGIQQSQSHLEDDELAHALSLSLKTAAQEKALRKLEAYKSTKVGDMGKMTSSNGRRSRLEIGSSSIQDKAEDVEEQPQVRHRSGHMSSASVDYAKEIEEVEVSPPSSPGQHEDINHPPQNASNVHSNEWGSISSEERDEAIMLEAALFGGIPEGSEYHFPYAPHQLMQNGLDRTSRLYPQRIPHPPSPNLTAQHLIREGQDGEYLASLQADRERELKALEQAEAWSLEEQAAREAALEEEELKEEESHRKLEEEQEIERHLVAKEASLPREPTSDDENAVTLLVRMPDSSCRGRRFLKSDKIQSLFDFIDVARGVKPGTYRLVRPYPRRAFSDGESASTLNELGLTSKQVALFLELI